MSRLALAAISSTTDAKAASLAREGCANPLILRTNCSAAAWTSSSVAGGSKLNNGRMLRHMANSLGDAPATLSLIRTAGSGKIPRAAVDAVADRVGSAWLLLGK